MRKTFRMYLTLALVMLGVMSVSAQERISLQEVPFTTWEGGNDGYGKDATAGSAANCAWVLDEPTSQPYGDSQVINGADLSLYSKLIITYTEGTPRVMLNRDVYEGQWSGTEADSKLIEYPKDGWSSKYFTVENGNTLIVDLKQIVKDKGYARLHAIKGANWANVTVTSMELERQGKGAQVGWTNLATNSDFEGDDVSSFFIKEAPSQDIVEAAIYEGIGKNESRGVTVSALAGELDGNGNPIDYQTQFWVMASEVIPAGAKLRLSFDYRASQDVSVSTQAHAAPGDYIHYELFGNVSFTTDWQHFEKEIEVTEKQAQTDKGLLFQSVAFNLSPQAEGTIDYFFDNVKLEVYKYGTTAEFGMDVVKLDFGFDTNISELVKAGGKPRLIYPEGCATVKADGKEQAIMSVEAFEDGRFYIFPESMINNDSEVEVTFANPADPAYHIIYTSGPGGDVGTVNAIATYNSNVPNEEGAYPYVMETPVIVKANPEDGSFNLPNSITEFKITFDKVVDCAALVATLGSEKLAVAPATGFAEEITLTRAGGDLVTGQYTLTIDKVYPEWRLADEIYGTYTLKLNVGKVELDPDDKYEVIMTDDFENGGEGWYVNGDGNWQPANSGSGCRIIDSTNPNLGVATGMGFKQYALYMGCRADGNLATATFGNHPDEGVLSLKAKTYHLSFGAARWDSGAATLKVQIFPAAAIDEEGYADESQLVAEESKAIMFDYKSSTDATRFDVAFTAPAEGNYVLKFITSNSEGNPVTWGDAVALGDVKVEYIPNTAGAEETRLLNEALENAKTVREANTGDRYAGEAYEALVAVIAKYEAEKDGYTAPSQYKEAADVLNAAAQAVKEHRILCDNYDAQIKKALDVERQNKEKKFARTTTYAQVQALVAKYHGSSEFVNESEDPEVENWQVHYTYDVLTDDATLSAAVPELEEVVNLASYLFTEGESKRADEGIKVLVERIRLGAEALKSLGVPADDELIEIANNVLTDDDSVAEAIKTRLKLIIYEQLADKDNTLFDPVFDEDEFDDVTPKYDMTVFVKNPNIYSLHGYKAYTEEDVPGWVVPTGNGEVSTAWTGSGLHQIEGLAADVCFTKYHANTRIEQTIDDLPAGVYTVVIDAVSWADDDTTDGYAFVKTTDMPEGGEEGEELFTATLPLTYRGQYQANGENVFEGVEITDGILTLGVNFGPNSQYVFDQVKLYLSGAADADYSSLYKEVVDGVEGTEAEPAKVRAIELYDLNGRRITTARQGVVIVKKIMSDGSVRTEKVVKK